MRHQGDSAGRRERHRRRRRRSLEARGHTSCDGRGRWAASRAFAIDQTTGVLMGGSDPRKDGLAIGW